MTSRVSFLIPSDDIMNQGGCEPISWLAGFATPSVATFWRSLAAFQILAMRFAARVWIPGMALLLFMDLVGLIMFQVGKRLVLCVTMLLSH